MELGDESRRLRQIQRAFGNASGSAPLTTAPAVGDLVTATVTVRRLIAGFVFVLDETSEFSSCVTVV